MIFCLVRTDRNAKKQAGISFLLIDMNTPGITIRPIILLEGEHEVNEVFFNDVRVPAENLVGEENKGWTYDKYLLTHERTTLADPVYEEYGLTRFVVELEDDLLDECVDQPLLRPRIGRWRIPNGRKVLSELEEHRTIDLRLSDHGSLLFFDALLEFHDAFEGGVPTRFELARDVPFRWINQLISPRRQRSFVARGLEVALNGGDDVVGRTHHLVGREDRSLNRPIGYSLKAGHGHCHCLVDAYATDADAKAGANMGVVAAALLTVGVALRHAVEHAHHSPALATADQPGQQRPPTTSRLAIAVLLHMGVFEQQALVFLKVLPADVARMMIVDERRPFLSGLLVTTDLARPPVDYLGALAHPAEGIGASVERIMQDLHHAVISRRFPLHFADIDVAAHHGHLDRGRSKPEEHLARAAEFAELGEHQKDRFLDMLVGIQLDRSRLAPA
jgi:hypothetical protein